MQAGHPGRPGWKGVSEPGDEVGSRVSGWQEAEERSSSLGVVAGSLNTCRQKECVQGLLGRQSPGANPRSATDRLGYLLLAHTGDCGPHACTCPDLHPGSP